MACSRDFNGRNVPAPPRSRGPFRTSPLFERLARPPRQSVSAATIAAIPVHAILNIARMNFQNNGAQFDSRAVTTASVRFPNPSRIEFLHSFHLSTPSHSGARPAGRQAPILRYIPVGLKSESGCVYENLSLQSTDDTDVGRAIIDDSVFADVIYAFSRCDAEHFGFDDDEPGRFDDGFVPFQSKRNEGQG